MLRTLSFIGILTAVFMTTAAVSAQPIPDVHRHLIRLPDSTLVVVTPDGDTIPPIPEQDRFTLDKLRSMPVGTERGIAFDFGMPDLDGSLYYGFQEAPGDVLHPVTVYFKNRARIDSGRAVIPIADKLIGKYDMVDWGTTARMRLGYRITSGEGRILYEGKINVRGKGPFVVDTSIIEGPFVNLLTDSSAVISYTTSVPVPPVVEALGRTFGEGLPSTLHEVSLAGLPPDSVIEYTIAYGEYRDRRHFRTAPAPGTRSEFTFAYASDCRANQGGGERSMVGVNSYMMRRIAALSVYRNARFFQFTGDLIDGYTNSLGRIQLEYANWKRSIEPWAGYMPFVAGFGNHETLQFIFDDGTTDIWIDQFPWGSMSSEVVFARQFVNPVNGPVSEDGQVYDPNPLAIDFPPYTETAFWYRYDNVAMISMNSDYWYAPSITSDPYTGGNPHGYVMDAQLAWLEETLEILEADPTIDHVFMTIHTPICPNGGHVKDDMWYSGNNEVRPWVAGKPVEQGIIERRDEILDLLINHSSKAIAALTGDEHNYNVLTLTSEVNLYPEDWSGERLEVSRPFWLINNGAAGAPYYGKEDTPWMHDVRIFSTQNAVVFFHVNGGELRVEVVNPDTLELIDEFVLR
ncbi:hypothetical protein GF356_11240 [candidate division GN15 bacterium]|nr:hypothetical protein [candidate division GN15 bacterium]